MIRRKWCIIQHRELTRKVIEIHEQHRHSKGTVRCSVLNHVKIGYRIFFFYFVSSPDAGSSVADTSVVALAALFAAALFFSRKTNVSMISAIIIANRHNAFLSLFLFTFIYYISIPPQATAQNHPKRIIQISVCQCDYPS